MARTADTENALFLNGVPIDTGDPDNGDIWQYNSSTETWELVAGGTPGAPDYSVQYNDGAGGFAGNASFLFNTTEGSWNLNNYATPTQPVTGGNQEFKIGANYNTNSNRAIDQIQITNENNAGSGVNTGYRIINNQTSGGYGTRITQNGIDGQAQLIDVGDNIRTSSTEGIIEYTLTDTQNIAVIMQEIDLGNSALANVGLQINSGTASIGSAIQLNGVGDGTNIFMQALTSAPANTGSKLYNLNGVLYFDGVSLEGGAPGGSDTYIQYNDGGVLGGISAFTLNDTLGTINLNSTLNTNSATNADQFYLVNQNNAGAGYNTGLYLGNLSTSLAASQDASFIRGAGLGILQAGVDGCGVCVLSGTNANTSTYGLANFSFLNAQTATGTAIKVDTGTSEYDHLAALFTGTRFSIQIDDADQAPSTTTNKLYAVGGNLFWNGTQLN